MVAMAAGIAFALAPSACSLALDFSDECSADGDCDRGERCDRGFCVQRDLLEEGVPCDRLIGPDPRDAGEGPVLLLGTLLPKSGALGPFGLPMEQGVELAVTQINQIGGVLGQKLAVLACDTGTNPAQATVAARHLVDVGRVQAIIGAGASGITIETFNRVAKPAGVLMISPASTSPAITDLPDEGLLWRTAPSDAIQGRAIAAWLREQGFQRIAVVNRDDAYGNGLAGVVQEVFCQAGCPAGTFRIDIYPADAEPPILAQRQAGIVGEVKDFAPDAVVLVAFAADGLEFLRLAQGMGLRFVLTDGMKDLAILGDRLADPPSDSPGVDDDRLICDVVGTNPGSPNPAFFAPFAAQFQARFGITPRNFEAQSYDAAYLVGFAYAAAHGAGVAAPDGRALAHGLTRVSEGESVRIGPDGWNQGVAILNSGALTTIDVVGVSGELDFDPASGEAPGSIDMWRFDPDAPSDADKIENLGIVLDDQGRYIEGVVTARPAGHSCATP